MEALPSIGRPIADTIALILDADMRPVPAGEAGELCLGGTLVGRGYRNNPELTARQFVHYTPEAGSPFRVYRTGDRARLLANGEIAFLGRLDDQVKLRGYRIELGEIITWIDRCPGIEASAVVVRGAGSEGEPQLVAYIVPAHGTRLTSSDLSAFLAARLPEYMIPECYVPMTALPITANGKLDKSALPAPTADNVLAKQGSVLNLAREVVNQKAESFDFTLAHADRLHPDNLEAQVAEIVTSLLGQKLPTHEDNFFMAGGHSMLGVQLVARIRDVFGVKMTLRQLFVRRPSPPYRLKWCASKQSPQRGLLPFNRLSAVHAPDFLKIRLKCTLCSLLAACRTIPRPAGVDALLFMAKCEWKPDLTTLT